MSNFSASTKLLLVMRVHDGELWADESVMHDDMEPVLNTRRDVGDALEIAAFKVEWNRRARLLRRLDTDADS
jgi:hypothetical protein